MTNDKMDENDPLCGMPGFKCKWSLDATVGEERQAMTVEPLIRIFDEMRAGNPAERQHNAKDIQKRRHRTDTGRGR
jgi:hypothetical protein